MDDLVPLPIFFYTDIPTCNRRDDDAFLPILFSYLLPFGFDIRGKAVVFIKYIVMIMVKDGILTILALYLYCTLPADVGTLSLWLSASSLCTSRMETHTHVPTSLFFL